MFSKAAILIAVALVLLGYRWGKRKAAPPAPAQVVFQPAAQKQPSWLSVRVLLIIVIILLVIAILSSISGRIG